MRENFKSWYVAGSYAQQQIDLKLLSRQGLASGETKNKTVSCRPRQINLPTQSHSSFSGIRISIMCFVNPAFS